MEVDISPGDLKDRKADSRGRINLGSEYADKKVMVAILEVGEDDD
ncbi:hypothetical protein GCM10009549_58270 [Streptomyces thermoalcalitolerans]|uniref:Uncharacterized protein n=1 Tax=Streptomyces thermoalcalitolerans TaxID=65605 RepID=A0ABP4ACI3_9ACTN